MTIETSHDVGERSPVAGTPAPSRDHQPLAALVVPVDLPAALFGCAALVAHQGSDLGGTGAIGTSRDGSRSWPAHPLAGTSRVQITFEQGLI